jgi:hypothetical protein
MRRILIYLIALLPLSAAAQVGEYRTDLAVGFSAGYVSSQVGFIPEVPQKRLGGFIGGLTVRYTCERYFSSICAIVAEFNIARTGWKENILDVDNGPVYAITNPGKTSPLYYERHLTYLQIPFLARLGWGRERKGLQAFIQVGPQIAVNLGESTNTNMVFRGETLNDRSSKIVAQDSMAIQRKFDYGIAVGAGLEFSAPHFAHFIVEGRYYYGLGDIFNNSKSDYFGRSNLGQIVIKATYLFDIIRTKNPKIK